jgi:hypothetical protein
LHVAREKKFEAPDDIEALRKSRLLVEEQSLYRAFELWHGDQRVGGDIDDAASPPTLLAR